MAPLPTQFTQADLDYDGQVKLAKRGLFCT